MGASTKPVYASDKAEEGQRPVETVIVKDLSPLALGRKTPPRFNAAGGLFGWLQTKLSLFPITQQGNDIPAFLDEP
ncbi:hypothetical protein [Parasphingorhabdus sp.]|uniref:hypothetical protein n=1 Tax=Parasphingorhabdus sp. TaxID=2709688 RepID=UPI0032634059